MQTRHGAAMSFPLSSREAELTAELVRERLRHHLLLEQLSAVGTPAMLGYSPDAVWITAGGQELARIPWLGWYDTREETREDRAILVVSRLLTTWRENGAAL
ncbi:MAG TPA: hypothetical protein VF167_08150 [Longimicrobiaceae bacterium]